MQRLPMNDLIEFCKRLFLKRGLSEENAAFLAELLVETEAFRQSTHGIVQLKGSLSEGLDVSGNVETIRDHGASAVVNGHKQIANLAIRRIVELASAKAREYGISAVFGVRMGWSGALGSQLIGMARDGLVAQAFAQSNKSKCCAPFGGLDPRLGNGPMAIAFPAGEQPMMADFTAGAMSMGRVKEYIAEERQTAVPRFLDKTGELTCDPKVLRDGGAMLFSGGDIEGHKGYAFLLLFEALAVLAGGMANNPDHPESHGTFGIIALDPESFAGREYYDREMKRFVEHLKGSRTRPGFPEVHLPGERGFARLADARANGVPLSDDNLDLLRELAERFDVPMPQ